MVGGFSLLADVHAGGADAQLLPCRSPALLHSQHGQHATGGTRVGPRTLTLALALALALALPLAQQVGLMWGHT